MKNEKIKNTEKQPIKTLKAKAISLYHSEFNPSKRANACVRLV